MLYAMEHQKTIVESYFENKVTIVHGKVPKFQVKFPVFMVTPFFGHAGDTADDPMTHGGRRAALRRFWAISEASHVAG